MLPVPHFAQLLRLCSVRSPDDSAHRLQHVRWQRRLALNVSHALNQQIALDKVDEQTRKQNNSVSNEALDSVNASGRCSSNSHQVCHFGR
jgi:hypothetical protein